MDYLGECWEWPSIGKDGYGLARGANDSSRMHVRCWESLFGRVPRGLELHHACENKACCNPLHLRALTRKEHKREHYQQTECRYGHGPDEYVVYKDGQRRCRACNRERMRATSRSQYNGTKTND
jgi:hypothetical protein